MKRLPLRSWLERDTVGGRPSCRPWQPAAAAMELEKCSRKSAAFRRGPFAMAASGPGPASSLISDDNIALEPCFEAENFGPNC